MCPVGLKFNAKDFFSTTEVVTKLQLLQKYFKIHTRYKVAHGTVAIF